MTTPSIANTLDDIVPADKAAKISGLDYLLAILHGEFPVSYTHLTLPTTPYV